MSHEQHAGEIFFLELQTGQFDATPGEVEDPLTSIFEQWELEKAGGPVLPAKEIRLRSQREDGEPLEKRAGDRGKIALAMFLKRRLALGDTLEEIIAHAAAHSREVANDLRTTIAEGWLERIEA
jgi:hypothetical protein